MNVLMLGNGFDINYKLLTKYINFLNTVNYLSTETLGDILSVGDIFGAEKLQKTDIDIARSFQQNQQAYNNTPIDSKAIEQLIALAQKNMLFSFLLKSFNRDVGWIDFEKEISVIIHAFQNFLELEHPIFSADKYPESKIDRYIIGYFAFFYQPSNPQIHDYPGRKVIDEYVIEYPQGSSIKIINKAKIIEALEMQMVELSEGLRVYLQCFVENVVLEMRKLNVLQPLPALTGADHVVTFNYTNTYEHLYQSGKVYHIHGTVNDSIILGVNPDDTDELSGIDVSFLRFKKYYQRVIRHSDDEYLAWITRKHPKISLVVMGHSLDVTDKDIIMQMFDLAKDITVLYFSESAKASLVANLVSIYGKEKFDELRLVKRLRFLSQNEPFDSFAEDRYAKEKANTTRIYY